jgi:hypothetical protein
MHRYKGTLFSLTRDGDDLDIEGPLVTRYRLAALAVAEHEALTSAFLKAAPQATYEEIDFRLGVIAGRVASTEADKEGLMVATVLMEGREKVLLRLERFKADYNEATFDIATALAGGRATAPAASTITAARFLYALSTAMRFRASVDEEDAVRRLNDWPWDDPRFARLNPEKDAFRQRLVDAIVGADLLRQPRAATSIARPVWKL